MRVQSDAAIEPDIATAQSSFSDDAESDQKPHGEEPDETWPGDDGATSDKRDDKVAEDEANEPFDVARSSDAETAEGKFKASKPAKRKFHVSWSRVLVYGVLPGAAMLLAAAAGFLKWQDSSVRAQQIARIESVAAAKDSAIALLSYKSDTVDKELDAAKSRLTGAFKDSYSQLINDVVIPGAKRGHVSTTATVPAAASVSATPSHAVVLLYVDQTAVVGNEPPAESASSVRATLDKVDGRWLVSGFDPV